MEKRLEEFEILRAIACISVIIIHISAAFVYRYELGSLHSKVIILINASVKYAVPTFVFISGFMLARAYENRKIDYIGFVKKKCLVILVPYVIWSAIYYLYYMSKGFYPFSIVFFLKNLLLGSTIYHLYYIIIIMQFYFLAPFWIYVTRKFKSLTILITAMILNYVVFKFLYFAYSDRFFMTYLSFFVLGLVVAKNYELLKPSMMKYRWVVGSIFAFCLMTYAYKAYQFYRYNILVGVIDFNLFWYIYSLVAIFALLMFSIIFENKKAGIIKISRKISRQSYYMYLSHPLLIIICVNLIEKLKIVSITKQVLFQLIVVIMAAYYLSVAYFKVRKIVGKYILMEKELI